MESILPDDPGTAPHRGRLNRAVKESLRDLGAQLSLLNHGVGARLDLKGTDLECLDLITRYGPLSPSALARRAGLHPATLTGILDRLERGGWIERGRDPSDRRGVVVQAARGRGAEVLRLYLVDSGMNTAMDQICAGYEDKDLQLLSRLPAPHSRRRPNRRRKAHRKLSSLRNVNGRPGRSVSMDCRLDHRTGGRGRNGAALGETADDARGLDRSGHYGERCVR